MTNKEPIAPSEEKIKAMAVCDTSAALTADAPEITMSDVGKLARAYLHLTRQNAAESLPAQPEQAKLTDVYEVYGKSARSQGWDFLVCKTLKEALGVIESDMDELDADPDAEDEVRIVFRRYTEAQMEDVIL